MKANFKELDKLTKEGYLRRVISNEGDLILYNYTDACTYARNWGKHTLNARGTVYDLETGEAVAIAFKKFMNFEELAPTDQRRILKLKKFTAFEKMDGSLGIIFNYKGRWYVNTRGSFSSDQAKEGLRLLREKYNIESLNKNYTYLAEIITPATKIILDYQGAEMLSCLGIMDITTGKELSQEEYIKETARVGFHQPKIYEFDSIEEVIAWKKALGADNEGVVVLYHFSGKIHRVKFKSNKYLEVAKIISNINYLSLWGNMIFGKVSPSYLEQVPEEFRYALDDQQVELEDKFKEELNLLVSEFKKIKDKNHATDRDFASDVQKSSCVYKGTFYSLNKVDLTEDLIFLYRKTLEDQICPMREHQDLERTRRVSPDELRVKLKETILKSGNADFKKVLSIEEAIMKRMRPHGNNF